MRGILPKTIAIHDLSGFGRSSLSVIMPILSIMGVQVCAVPTALLSTHTGDFYGYSFLDLSTAMQDIYEHWDKLDLKFDSIYSGFLGSSEQTGLVTKYIDRFADKDTIVLVDPVMADDGKLYQTMDREMVSEMRKLIGKAQIITPNLTEAAFLLDAEYREEMEDGELKEWLLRLADFGPEKVVITSVHSESHRFNGVAAYDKQENRAWKIVTPEIEAKYPGTGDVFASVVLGALMSGLPLYESVSKGISFIIKAVGESSSYDYPIREGVLLEKFLGGLLLDEAPLARSFI